MRKNILVILLLIIVFNCETKDDNSGIVNVESILIGKGSIYGNGAEGISEQNLVITDQVTWHNLIIQMNSVNNVSDSFSETNIDFSEYKIIAVFDEIKGSGGHVLELNITANSHNVIVSVTDLAPSGNATTVMTQPFHIVKIAHSTLPIVFK